MTKRDESIDPEVRREIKRIQRNSRSLQAQDIDLTAAKHAPGTTTISVRMNDTDVRAIAALAKERDVPLSNLVREWILIGLAGEPRGGIKDALQDLERSFAALRRAIRAEG